jgi:large subunit ribosomal protein L21
MFSRTIRRSILDTKIASSALPPTFLLPSRARYLQTTVQHVETPPQGLDPSQLPLSPAAESIKSSVPSITTASPLPPRGPPLHPEPITTPLKLDSSIREMLPLLAAQPSHYISIHIHGKPYLVTAGDTVRLPFHMPGVIPGDILRLNRAANLGSRDYTLKGTPYLDERLFECRARVIGVESEPMRIKEKKKRRNRRINTVKSKQRFTILKISELKINSIEQLDISTDAA